MSEATRRTVQTLAGRGSRIVYSRTCSQQTNTDDCGCYALAYTATIALGGTKTWVMITVVFVAAIYIHNSVCSCFGNRTTGFNLRQSCTRLLLFAFFGVSVLRKYAWYSGDPATFELEPASVRLHVAEMVRRQQVTPFPFVKHCYCSGPAGGRMVACDGCDSWFHTSCLSSKRLQKGSWWCRKCRATSWGNYNIVMLSAEFVSMCYVLCSPDFVVVLYFSFFYLLYCEINSYIVVWITVVWYSVLHRVVKNG